MRLDLNKAGVGQNLPSLAQLREELRARTEDLFRAYWREPDRPGAAEWRAREDDARSMVIRGAERGAWTDHKAGRSGGPLEFFAIHELAWDGVPAADNERLRELRREAARWLGIDVSQPVTQAELDRRRVESELREAQRAAEAQLQEEQEQREKAAVVAAVRAAARPVEGTPAETYLLSRGITLWPSEAVAYAPSLKPMARLMHASYEALVVWARNADGEIVGGQRIVLQPDGSKAPVDTPKPSFGTIGGSPARLPARSDSTDLIIAEGPETALAIWSVMGCEAWAVFGAGQFKDAPLPIDRRVIFAPDQDAAGSPAAQAFDTALVKHSAMHADLWVARAPEPEGSKSDLNDTLLRAGPEAVRAAFASPARVARSAPLRVRLEHKPFPDLQPADEARAAISRAVDVFFEDVAAHKVRPAIQASIFPEGPLHVIAAGLGLGKTTAALAGSINRQREQLARYEEEMSAYNRELELFKRLDMEGDVEPEPPKKPAAMLLVPMHRLSEQVLAEGKKLAPDLTFAVLRGVDAEDPDAPGEKVCKRIDEYHEEVALLFDPTTTICKQCPFATTCKAVASKAAIADIYVAAHGSLGGHPAALAVRRGQRLDHVIIDEDPTNALLFDDAGRTMGFAAWRAARSSGEVLDMTRQKLALAAAANGCGPLRREFLVAAKIEPEDADRAAEAEWHRTVAERDAADIDENRTVRRTAGIWSEIAAFLRKGKAASGRLTVIQDKVRGLSIQHIGVTTLHEGWTNAPILMLDATVEPQIVEAVMGRSPTKLTRAYADEPMLVIRQDPSKSGAKSMVLEHEWASESANRAARRWQQHLVKHVKRRAKRAKQLLFIASKELIDLLKSMLPPNVATAHFGALRGLNDYQDADRMIIVGRWMPQQGALEARTAALFDVPVRGEINVKATVQRLARGETGVFWADGKGTTHSDPLVDMVLRSIRDAEVEQAIGRARAVNRTSPVIVELLSDAIVRHPVDISEIWRKISNDDPLADMLAEGGVALESPAHAAQAYPQLYKTKQAAQYALAEFSTGQETSYSHLYDDFCPVRVSYRVPRRADVFAAAVDNRQHSDPVGAICAMIPKAMNVRVISDNIVSIFRNGAFNLNLAPSGPEELAEGHELGPTNQDTHAGSTAPARHHIRNDEFVPAVDIPASRRQLLPTACGPIYSDDELLCAPRLSIHGAEVVIFRGERPDERERRTLCERVSPLMAALRERRLAVKDTAA